MVQIQRPPTEQPPTNQQPASQLGGQVAVGQSDVDSQAITEDGIAQDEEGSLATAEMPEGFSGSEDLDADESAVSAVPPQWQSDRTRRSRQIALVVALSFSGLLTAVAIFSWFVRSWQTSAATTAETVAPTVEPPSVEAPTSTNATDAATAAPVDSTPSGDPSNGDPASGEPASDTEEIPPPDATTDEPANPEPIPQDLLSTSPIPQDPTSQQPPADPDPATNNPDDERGTMQELPPELAIYAPLLLQESPTVEATLKAPPTMDEVRIEAATADGPDPLEVRIKTLNLKADLAIELALASDDDDGYPLADLMLLVSQITGVPIQLDWVSLDMAGIDINALVPIKGRRSARQLLDDVASTLGGEIREEKTLVVFTLTDAKFDEVMAMITDLTDFGDSQSSAISVLNQFLGADAGMRELQIGPTREDKQLAVLAIESLRRMRGIEPKIPNQRLQRWSQVSEHDLVQWPRYAGGKAGPQYDAPITIAGFLRRTARGNHSTCVVNWHDANRRGLAPEKLLIPFADADAATSLDKALSAFGIQVRQVDAQHWWVGSESTYDHLPVVVWTSPLGTSRDIFDQRIRAVMAANPDDVYLSAIDVESDRALLLLPRYIVRQLPKIAASIAAN